MGGVGGRTGVFITESLSPQADGDTIPHVGKHTNTARMERSG